MRTPLATAGSRGDFIEDCIARTGEICHGRSLLGVGKPTGAIGTWSGAKEKDAGASGRKLEGDGGRAGTTRRLPGPRWSFPGRAGSFDFAGLALGGGEEGERKARFGLDFEEDRRREAREAICGGREAELHGEGGLVLPPAHLERTDHAARFAPLRRATGAAIRTSAGICMDA